MTLSEVLKQYNNKDFDAIEYRYMTADDSSSVDNLAGFAAYKNKMLISLDGDTYHLSDNIIKHGLYQENWLVVWI